MGGSGAGLSLRLDAHPVAGRTGKFDDIGGWVLALQMIAEFGSGVAIRKDTNLHAPLTAAVEWLGRFQYIHTHASDPGAAHAGFGCRAAGEIDHTTGNKRPAIGYGDDGRLAGCQVGDAGNRSQRQSAVGRGHRILVVDLAIGGAAVVIRFAIPTGDADFTVKNFSMSKWRRLDWGFRIWLRRSLGLLYGWGRWRWSLGVPMRAPGDKQAQYN